jgi:hypothetical protein
MGLCAYGDANLIGKGQDGSNGFKSLGRIWRFPATAIFDLNNACVDICQV